MTNDIALGKSARAENRYAVVGCSVATINRL